MWAFIGLISFVAFFVMVALGLIKLFRKKSGAKKSFVISGICFVLFIVGMSNSPTTSTETEADGGTVVTASTSGGNATKEEVNKAEKEAKEAEEKAKADAEAKKKEEEEAKAKAEEEAKAKEEAKKSVMANAMQAIVPSVTGDQELSKTTYDYIVNNYTLFPAKTAEDKAAAKELVDTSVNSKHLFKNINPYLDRMIKVSGYVVQVQEEETDIGTLATIHIMDDNGNSIIGVYLGSTGDLLDGDNATLRGTFFSLLF